MHAETMQPGAGCIVSACIVYSLHIVNVDESQLATSIVNCSSAIEFFWKKGYSLFLKGFKMR